MDEQPVNRLGGADQRGNDQPSETHLLDGRVLDVARNGRDDLEDMLDELLTLRDDAPETRRWLQSELDQARQAAANGNSEDSISRLASAAETFLNWDLPELTAMLCGLAVNYSAELDVEPVDEANLLNVTGLLAFRLGRLDAAQDLFTHARGQARTAEDRGMEAATVLNLCNVARVEEDFGRARQLAEEALRLYDAVNNQRGSTQLRLTLANMELDTGHFGAAEQWLHTLEAAGARPRQPDLTASYHHIRARLLAHQRRWDEAERAMQSSLRAARRAHHSDHEVATLQSLAALADEAGKKDLARRRTRAAIQAARERRLTHRLVQLLPSYISGEIRAGNVAAALAAGHELLELSQAVGANLDDAHNVLGAALFESGDPQGALDQFQIAYTELDGTDTPPRGNLTSDLFHNTVMAHSRLGTIAQHLDELTRRAERLPDTAKALEHLGLAMAREHHWDAAERLLLQALDQRPATEQAWSGLVTATQLEDYDSAAVRTTLLRRVLIAAQENSQDTVALKALNSLALARVDDGDLAEGLALLDQNLNAAQAAGDRIISQQCLHNLAETHRRLGNLAQAETDARAALETADILEDEDHRASSWVQLGIVLSQQDKLDEARHCFERALALSKTTDSAHASALSGLAGLAIANEDLTTAATLYTESLRLDTRSPVQRLENLIYLCQALAGTNQRRRYLRRMQQVVDAAPELPLENHMAVGMARVAERWSSAGKPNFAGEALALAIIIWAQRAQREDTLASDDSPMYSAIAATAYELRRQAAAGEAADQTKAAIKRELRHYLQNEEVVSTLLELLESAGEFFAEE